MPQLSPGRDRWMGQARLPAAVLKSAEYAATACAQVSHAELHRPVCGQPMRVTGSDVLPGPAPPRPAQHRREPTARTDRVILRELPNRKLAG